ncbi:MAG: RluA family pseudouridine synthase [Pseudomonadota bacterium]
MSEKENNSNRDLSQVRFVSVDSDSDGQRVDNFVLGLLPGVPKSRVYRMLRKGEVRINKGRAKPTTRVAAGDTVRIPPVFAAERSATRPPPGALAVLRQRILFEDKGLLVVNKPSGMAVHGGSGLSFGVVEALRSAGGDWAEVGLAHRLDRETSGVLVLAKRRSALRQLHAAFREERVSKVYQALVTGNWQHGGITIDAPLAVHERRGGERHVVVSASGKPSITQVAPIDVRKAASLLTLRPETGRTHQIRVHLQYLGHPIACDLRYGDPEANASFRADGLERLFLHAQSIAFDDGVGGEQLFSAPLPDRLQAYVAKILARPGVNTTRRRKYVKT